MAGILDVLSQMWPARAAGGILGSLNEPQNTNQNPTTGTTNAEMSPALRFFNENALRSLGIGPGANVVDALSDVARYYTGNLLFPMERLHAYRQSPEYRGNKPSGNTREETEALRRQAWQSANPQSQ